MELKQDIPELLLVECPRDAMQGIHDFIPTAQKVKYLNALLKVGFHSLDFGSFVSPRMVPQLADTREVLEQLDWASSPTKLLAIVANASGALRAAQQPGVHYLGYPFSVSETFQKRNTNKTIAESLVLVDELQEICAAHHKELVVYLSMGFGNPYGEEWSPTIVQHWADVLVNKGIKILSLSDTIGTSTPQTITELFGHLIPAYPGVSIGAHLHTAPHSWNEKVSAAYQAGCRRFDGAIRGFGGCPFAEDELVGNMPMEKLISFAAAHNLQTGLNLLAFESAYNVALDTFPRQ